jgi:ABC-2 type transport system ATP-binding protein
MMQPRESAPIIVVDDVYKTYSAADGFAAWIRYRGRPPRRTILHGVSFTVGRGELVGLLGPNGAGKTTLLKSLAGLLLPDQGRIVVDGIDVSRDPLGAKRQIGYCVSEERSFYYRLTARRNLEFFGALYGLRGAELRRRVELVATQVDIRSALDRRFAGFSSGMRQRLTVARALLGNPQIVLLDEPTRAVDPVHAAELRAFIRHELIETLGKTIVLATNSLEEAWQLCDRIIVVNNGRIVALGPPSSLGGSLQRVSRYELVLDDVDETLLARTRAIPGLTLAETSRDEAGTTLRVEIAESEHSLTELCRTVGTTGSRVRSIKSIEPSPVDVFQKVTNGDG